MRQVGYLQRLLKAIGHTETFKNILTCTVSARRC